MTINTEHFKEILLKEKESLESELGTLGRKNPDNSSDWEATESEDTDQADEAEVADSMEKYGNNRAVLDQLEIRLNQIKSALGKIEDGTYGICDVGGEQIEEDRLNANPSATTCKAHMN